MTANLGATVGQLLQQARVAKGLSREALALELKLPLRHIEAIEADDWAALPAGRPRPLARQLGDRLGVDLEYHTGAFQIVPGGPESEPTDPRQERLERVVMGLLTAASVLVVLWLVVPGPRLGRKPTPSYLSTLPRATLPPPPAPSEAPYPVLGELLPEAPLNEQGVLVSLRAMDACEVRIEADMIRGGPPARSARDVPPGTPHGVLGQSPSTPSDTGGQPPMQVLTRTLRVSEPWRLRVKGPFTLTLGNAGVVNVEVAGRHVPHGQSIGEVWTGRFDAEGRWVMPALPALPAEPPVPDDEAEDGTRP